MLCLILAATLVSANHEGAELVDPAHAHCCLGWYQPQVGDLLLFQHTGSVRNIIYSLGCSGGATHSAVVVARPDGTLGMLEAPGAEYPVMISDIPSRLQSYQGRVWIRRRRIPLTPEQCRRLTEFACAQEGKPFDNIGFILPPFGCPIRKHTRRCLTACDLNPPRWFCSSLCVGAFVAAGLVDAARVRPRFTDPEDLKTDRPMNLSRCWENAVRWHRCGPRTHGWWSRICCGKSQYWQE